MTDSPTPKTQEWITDECYDANGFVTVRLADGTSNGDTESQPVATFHQVDDAHRAVHACNELPKLEAENARLREALESLLTATEEESVDSQIIRSARTALNRKDS